MANTQKLPLSDVRELVHSIEAGSPLDRELLEKHPWITIYSQDTVREIYGDRFSVWTFETLPVNADVLKNETKMVTTNPRRMWIEMSDHRSFSWGLTNKNVEREQVILKYEMTPERVIAYMPLLIEIILDTYGENLKRWKSKYGKSLDRVLTRSLYETEEEKMVVGVNGLEPVLMDFRIGKNQWQPRVVEPYIEPGVLEWSPKTEVDPDLGPKAGEIWWWDKKLVWDLMLGWDTEGPEAFARKLIHNRSIVPDEEWTEDRIIDFFREVYRKIEEFFAP